MCSKINFIPIVISAMAIGCGQHSASPEIAGSYFRLDSNQFCRIKQVITIKPATTTNSGGYTVSIKSFTDYFDDRKDQVKTREPLSAKYDPSSGVLTTADPGIVFYFDEKTSEVKLNKLALLKEEVK